MRYNMFLVTNLNNIYILTSPTEVTRGVKSDPILPKNHILAHNEISKTLNRQYNTIKQLYKVKYVPTDQFEDHLYLTTPTKVTRGVKSDPILPKIHIFII